LHQQSVLAELLQNLTKAACFCAHY
jgi:hypothetical protein